MPSVRARRPSRLTSARLARATGSPRWPARAPCSSSPAAAERSGRQARLRCRRRSEWRVSMCGLIVSATQWVRDSRYDAASCEHWRGARVLAVYSVRWCSGVADSSRRCSAPATTPTCTSTCTSVTGHGGGRRTRSEPGVGLAVAVRPPLLELRRPRSSARPAPILHVFGGPALAVAGAVHRGRRRRRRRAGRVDDVPRAVARDRRAAARRRRAGRARGAPAAAGRARPARQGAHRGIPAAATSIWSPSRTTTASLDAGAEVLIVEVRGNVAIVERAPETSPAGRT